jgi:arylsulfatase A-like enzyme
MGVLPNGVVRWFVTLLAVLAAGALAPALVAAPRPNIVLIVTDDQRWDTLGVMPTVQSELVRKGVTFSNAFVVNPLCCPSRASILTGNYSHSTGVYWNIGQRGGFGAFRDSSTIASWLRGAGYRTALVGKYLNGYAGTYIPPGWSNWVAFSGASDYFNYTLNVRGSLVPHENSEAEYSTDVLAGHADAFVRSTREPFLLYFAPFAPHFTRSNRWAVTPAPRHREAFADLPPWRPPSYNEAEIRDKPPWLRAIAPLTETQQSAVDRFRQGQLRALLAVDEAVGSILRALAETGRLENTIIVYTSDNGHTWGEHRRFTKVDSFEESIRVPFAVRYDALVQRQRTDNRLVANIDLAPTLAALAGAGARPTDGKSLVPLLAQRRTSWRSSFLVEHLGGRADVVPTYCAVRGQRYSYTQYRTGVEELYDLTTDPFQLENRAREPALRRLLVRFRLRLRTLCRPAPPGLTPRSLCLITGTRAADRLRGTPFYDYICAGSGADIVSAGDSNDAVFGAAGHDFIRGGNGRDRLHGGPGIDRLSGGFGNDVILAADGRGDAVDCGAGRDSVVADRLDRITPGSCEAVRRVG